LSFIIAAHKKFEAYDFSLTHTHTDTHVAAQENKLIFFKEYLGRERVEKLGRARPMKTYLQRDGSQIILRLDYRPTST
jgi:hypothetical protein